MEINQSFENFFNITEKVTTRIITTNTCNLHCTFCDVGCDQPIKKSSSHIFRQSPFTLEEDSLEKFCKIFSGIGEENLHVLQGGEVTMLPIKKLVRMIDILSEYNRAVSLKTTGYNLTQIPIQSLNKIQHITVTDHGINSDAVKASKSFLANNYKGEWEINRVTEHRNTQEVVRHNQGDAKFGLSCDHLMSTLTFITPVIYPCCNSWAIMHNLNEDDLRTSLISAGWTIDNPDLVSTLSNWRESIPKMFLNSICAGSCYKTYDGNPDSFEILPHPKDKILRFP